jgi:hypothetical protein
MTKMAPAAAERSTITPATTEEIETVVALDPLTVVAGVVEMVTTFAVVVAAFVVVVDL